MRSHLLGTWLAPLIVALAVSPGAPQTPGPSPDLPPPSLPETFVRDTAGRGTLRAVRLQEPLTVDGRLDEAVYRTVRPATGFIQQEPSAGEPATEETEVWVFFDDRNIYIAFRCFDSRPDRMVANEMRRDSRNIWLNDNVTVIFDTFHNQRSAFFFQTTPLGAVRDALVVDENNTNYDWRTVWDVQTARFEGGWTVEMAIPFKSLRYPGTGPQTWGFNARRVVRSKNEQSLLMPVDRSYSGSGLFNIAAASTLVGIEAPPPSLNFELKPSLVSSLTTDWAASPPLSNDLDGAFSLDGRYGLSSSMTLDVTYNTDFAQVEIDEQQVNLTRFSLFFPEKREFFLEGQSIFDFGGTGAVSAQSAVPILFFTRRIGLDAGRPVPIQAGARLMGRAGRTSIGVLNIGTGDVPASGAEAATFLVARARQDILRRSSIGLLATRRGPALNGDGANAVYGVDAALAFYQNVQINSYYARSETAGLDGDTESYRGQFSYDADRYGLEVDRLKVGAAFNPEIGFVRRPDITRTLASARFSPRPASIRSVRKVGWEATFDRFVNGSGILESRLAQGRFRVELENADALTLEYNASFEHLPAPFRIARGVTLPAGGYHFNWARASYALGPARWISGTVNAGHGAFHSGERSSLGYNGRANLSSQLAVEPRLSVDRVVLPEGRFTTTLAGARTTYAISPRMFASALVQYSSSAQTLETNVRFRWEYQPGSDVFFVYTDGRDTATGSRTGLLNRGVAIKLTRLLRF